ncbi:MAG: DUF2975 domain-containing protein [Balneolaceae bacterium]|nr:DUF2975 domain-containing protein [Balneolaceae bacterium]
MKSPFSIKIVVWACNITLVILALSFLFGLFYFAKLPSLIAPNIDLEGVAKTSYRVSQSFLGDNYKYERVIDVEDGVDEENYYFTSLDNVYRVSFSDSLTLKASKVNQELSSSESSYFGLIQGRTIVAESTNGVPVRYAVPAVSLEKEVFVSYARTNSLSMLLVILYGIVFIWYLRKFIAGLLTPGFFTRNNAFYLKITAWMAIAAPFFMWLWTSLIRPDLFADLRFENASAVSSGLSQPLIMLLFGLVLLAIAWSFDQGVKLQKEQELTI